MTVYNVNIATKETKAQCKRVDTAFVFTAD